jgi:hypothetical protein
MELWAGFNMYHFDSNEDDNCCKIGLLSILKVKNSIIAVLALGLRRCIF